MTIWLALFILIIITSFILAYLSMKDYQETPAKSPIFGIFLIQDPHNFNNTILQALYNDASEYKSVITLERLFKGSKSALIITGPKNILQRYIEPLNLLEIEDFTNINADYANAWEVGLKTNISRPVVIEDIFKDIPVFETDEQFWWQLTLQASPIKKHSVINFLSWLVLARKSSNNDFQCQIRAVLYAPDPDRRRALSEPLESLGDKKLTKIPRPVTTVEILKSYSLRSITPADPYLLNITSMEVLPLVGKSG